MKNTRIVFAYKRYFLDFYEAQQDHVQRKIEWTLNLFQIYERVPLKFFKKIENVDGLFEIRIEIGNNIFRIFSFFDTGNLIVLGNGFQKKTQKTPKKEIKKQKK
jgi:phage-related protein